MAQLLDTTVCRETQDGQRIGNQRDKSSRGTLRKTYGWSSGEINTTRVAGDEWEAEGN